MSGRVPAATLGGPALVSLVFLSLLLALGVLVAGVVAGLEFGVPRLFP